MLQYDASFGDGLVDAAASSLTCSRPTQPGPPASGFGGPPSSGGFGSCELGWSVGEVFAPGTLQHETCESQTLETPKSSHLTIPNYLSLGSLGPHLHKVFNLSPRPGIFELKKMAPHLTRA